MRSKSLSVFMLILTNRVFPENSMVCIHVCSANYNAYVSSVPSASIFLASLKPVHFWGALLGLVTFEIAFAMGCSSGKEAQPCTNYGDAKLAAYEKGKADGTVELRKRQAAEAPSASARDEDKQTAIKPPIVVVGGGALGVKISAGLLIAGEDVSLVDLHRSKKIPILATL